MEFQSKVQHRFALAFFVFALMASTVQARNVRCTAVWYEVAVRLNPENREDTLAEAVTLKFTEVSQEHLEAIKKETDQELAIHVPSYIEELLARYPEITMTEVLAEARKAPSDKESIVRHESEYWHLRYHHFWGGGLRHPRLIKRLAMLEVRAGYFDGATGRVQDKWQRDLAIYVQQKELLRTGEIGERLDAVGRLAELGDERSLALLAFVSRKDPKLAVRASARLALLARGLPVQYDQEALKDIRASRFGEQEEGYLLAHEELARLPDAALAGFLDNSFLKIMDTELSETLLRNRSLEFVVEFLDHPDAWVRGMAIKALEGRYEGDVLPLYEKAMRDPNDVVKFLAAEGLATRSDPASRELLAAFGKHHELFAIRTRIAQQLKPPDPSRMDHVEILRSLDSTDKAEAVRAGRQLVDRPSNLVAVGLRSRHAEVRLLAAEALKHRRDPSAVRLAVKAFDAEREPVVEVRLAALEVLLASRTVEADKIIYKAFSDSNPRVRETAMVRSQEDGVLRSLATQPLHFARQLSRTEKTRLGQFENGLVRADHHLAREAAEHVYSMPEPGHFSDVQEFVEAQSSFLSGIPRGQRVMSAGSDPQTGFKYYYSMPRPGFETQRRVVSIAGTQGIMDLYADFHMGKRQLESPLFKRLKAQILKDLEAGHDIDITGHSLGGMPAGVLAYELQAASAAMANPGKVRLISWNGLGPKDVLKWRGEYDPKVAALVDATNYHVPGDIVWLLGNRIGNDVSLPGAGKFRPISSHVMSAISSAMEGQGLENASRTDREITARVAPFLAKHFGWVGDALQKISYQRTEMATLRKLLQARVEWARRYGYHELGPELDPWREEVDLIRENFRARNYDVGLRLIEAYEQMREEVLNARRRPVPIPLARPAALSPG